jgi:hypothetical protein
MSSTFSSPVTADGEQRQLLHVIQRCAGAVSGIKESGLRSALRAFRKATHRSPLLPVLGPAGIRQLEARLETALEDEENKSVEEWLEKCLTDIEIYTDAKEELDEAKAQVEFHEYLGRQAQDLFIYTITYDMYTTQFYLQS